MKYRLLLFMLILLPAFTWQAASAQAGITPEQVTVEYDFGQQITLRAKISDPTTVSQAQAILRAQGDTYTITIPASIDQDGNIQARHEISQARLRPFAEIIYSFRFSLTDGTVIDSPQYTFRYLDNRFEWQTLEEGRLRIHWYNGDLSFGQNALDAARTGLERSSRLLAASLREPFDIYIYTSSNDMKVTIEQSGQAWVAGHASPDLYLAVVSISPGPEQALSMERKIPHELAHILTYEVAGAQYPQLPIWLREGIATISEIYPSPDYPRSLEYAVETQTLLSFTNLCGDFPADASSRFLAYAQSESFTRYIVDEYGISSLNRLIAAYVDGLGCEQGVQSALGVSLSELEYAWRSEILHENRLALAIKNLSGYLLVFAVLLVLPLAPAFILPKQTSKKNEPGKSK